MCGLEDAPIDGLKKLTVMLGWSLDERKISSRPFLMGTAHIYRLSPMALRDPPDEHPRVE